MRYRILCYGDSNTWGYISGSDHQRYIEERWPRVLAKKLGDNFEIIEEGLNSRTLISDDPRPNKEGKNGYTYLLPCLDTHDPIDLVILMLGTNELKTIYKKTAEEIGNILEDYFVKKILGRKSQISDSFPKLLIVAPPIADDDGSGKYKDAYEKSLKLNRIYEKIAKDNNCYFVDNNNLETGIDKIHLTSLGHLNLASKVYDVIKEIYNLDNTNN